MRKLTALIWLAFAVACNPPEEKKQVDTIEKLQSPPKPKPAAPKPAEPATLAPADNVVNLEASDSMVYNAAEIKVQSGKEVTVNLKHTGKLGAEVMGHNFVLLAAGVDLDDFAKAAMAAQENGYIPADREADVIAHTEVIGGGETTSVTFAAPEPGTYTFVCTFPGHYTKMQGKFIVE